MRPPRGRGKSAFAGKRGLPEHGFADSSRARPALAASCWPALHAPTALGAPNPFAFSKPGPAHGRLLNAVEKGSVWWHLRFLCTSFRMGCAAWHQLEARLSEHVTMTVTAACDL